METLALPQFGWNSMDSEQITHVCSLLEQDGEAARLAIFLYLMGWKVAEVEHVTPQCDRLEKMTDEQVMEKLRKRGAEWLTPYITEAQQLLDHEDDPQIIIEDVRGEGRMSISLDNLMGAMHASMGWIDQPLDLVNIPEGTYHIGERDYTPPLALLQDITVERYTSMEMALSTIDSYVKSAREILKGRDISDADSFTADERQMIADHDREISRATVRFMCHVLTPKGEAYNQATAERNAKDMAEAPGWLVSLCKQYLQGCLQWYSGQYPKLFKGGGDGDSKKSQLTKLMDQTTSLMKYSGTYPNSEAVLREYMPAYFSWCNMMVIEGEAVKKMEDQQKAARHRKK